ncbi:MAG: PaaI family thioesterase [Rhizobiaceae bacterium]
MHRPTIGAEASAWIEKVLAGSPLAAVLGIGVIEAHPDRVILGLPFRPENCTVGTVVHGGALATLVDIAAAAASASALADGAAAGGATASLTIAYLAPADGVGLTAEAVVIQRSRSQTVSDICVRSADGGIIAKALVTSRIVARR